MSKSRQDYYKNVFEKIKKNDVFKKYMIDDQLFYNDDDFFLTGKELIETYKKESENYIKLLKYIGEV